MYPDLLKEAVSKYDKSQIEFYYALLRYLKGDAEQALQHVNRAVEIVSKIDALIETTAIQVLKDIISDTPDNVAMQKLEGIDNADIRNWGKFVREYIIKLKSGDDK